MELVAIKLSSNSTRLLVVSLAVLHTTHSMFGKLLVHNWRQCGDLDAEHSILVH